MPDMWVIGAPASWVTPEPCTTGGVIRPARIVAFTQPGAVQAVAEHKVHHRVRTFATTLRESRSARRRLPASEQRESWRPGSARRTTSSSHLSSCWCRCSSVLTSGRKRASGSRCGRTCSGRRSVSLRPASPEARTSSARLSCSTRTALVGGMPRWTIIDGQQRLTSLQLLLDAAHQVCELAGAPMAARQLEDLVRNPPHFCKTPADALKVWPTTAIEPRSTR